MKFQAISQIVFWYKRRYNFHAWCHHSDRSKRNYKLNTNQCCCSLSVCFITLHLYIFQSSQLSISVESLPVCELYCIYILRVFSYLHSSISMSIHLSVCQSASLSVDQSVCLSIYPSVHPSFCPSIHLSPCMSISLSVHLFVCPSKHPSISSICYSVNLLSFLNV